MVTVKEEKTEGVKSYRYTWDDTYQRLADFNNYIVYAIINGAERYLGRAYENSFTTDIECAEIIVRPVVARTIGNKIKTETAHTQDGNEREGNNHAEAQRAQRKNP